MKKFDRFLEYFLAFLMAVMLISVSWQVISRYLLGDASSFTDELARYMLIWVGMLGGAYAAGQRMHLAIDLLPSKLKGKSKYRLAIVINLLIIFFALVTLVIGGSRLVYITYSLGQTSAAMQIPIAFVYTILPISGLLIIYYKIRDINVMEPDNAELYPAPNETDN
ncbi:TRAP transporter small permease [Gracilimonas mengyeensis]|uniref:TRAP-type C4-dicarboxylate transport system, small permease component n=1 Tax=Gracilimonas mengyeensis TaxID=1302730 RepID=A0A521FDN4_9BACT|nr:TRAP transporter small permease [Gracilimonas mengyeensis]SMO94312.1 TRAP-type C4-dicarboxylate transport system, small permease component [Gracilimonas mengyeensis]